MTRSLNRPAKPQAELAEVGGIDASVVVEVERGACATQSQAEGDEVAGVGVGIAVGAIGRQVALQLAALGIPRLHLFDDDVVAVENLAPQGYSRHDLVQAKVDATAAWCQQLRSDLDLNARRERFSRAPAKYLKGQTEAAIFLCVDSIATRRVIWNAVRHLVPFVVDGRMAAEVIRVLASDQPALDTHYASTLFDGDDAYVGACTARSTIYSANIAAGLMVAQFTRWLRGIPVMADQM